MSKHFTNLHVHTDYSLLDGAISLDKLIKFGQEHEMRSLAISDHGNVFGAVKFFQKCKKAGIRPVLGMEAYFTEDASIKDANNKYYHLLLLVQNKVGYRNLCKLMSYAFTQGFYFKPRIDYKTLAKYSEGLIATSACLGGHIPRLLMSNQEEKALQTIDWFKHHFENRFYLEIQPEDQDEQKILNQKLYTLAQQTNIPLVATGDSHYVSAEDRYAHEVMLSIQTHGKIDDPKRYTFGDCRVHLRSAQDMLALFPDHEQAIWNSGEIADSCDFAFETDKLFFPNFEIPKQHTPESYFKDLCEIGLKLLHDRGAIPTERFPDYQARLQLEIELISKMGFVGYFLVVSDFIQWAHRTGIPVGPGRGSAAGSLVAWALQITNIDPLKYNLLFERFLNPERISMPDIDIDFCIEGRDRVIEYVRDKYGHDKVCHIITFGTMLAKGVIKDVARVLGIPFEDANAMTNLIPDQLKITLQEALEQEPRLKELIEGNPKAKQLFDVAFKLEGLTRHASKHAAGIVISPEAIDEVLPVYIPSKSTELVAQYAMTELESIGFLKIDFLGLKNLTLIDRVIQSIKANHGIALDINKLPLDDAKTFELICAGKTSGVFQLESEGLKDVLRKLQPACFEDIIAVNALYRPGPLGSGMVDDFIERKHGRQKITYLFDALEPILKETYGVIVYQEQVMKVASAIAGYSLGQADILRRAMGKKKAEVMAEQKIIFTNGAKERNFDERKAGELFDLMAYFAGYGFNKSHSAAYAMIAYQTAYLKANYPAEFMACLISLEANHAEKMSFYLQEAKDMALEIIPPDINRSMVDFTVDNGKLLFGLHGIKNVGLTAIENIIAERTTSQNPSSPSGSAKATPDTQYEQENDSPAPSDQALREDRKAREGSGPFKDLFDFCKRVDLRTSNKRVIENLVCAGAFDAMPGSRAQQYNEVPAIIEKAISYKKDKASGQMGLFNATPETLSNEESYTFAPCAPWTDKEKLEKEKDVIGFYLSAHPLETYKTKLRWFAPTSIKDVLAQSLEHQSEQEMQAVVCGLLKSRKDIVTKKGDRMAFIQLEDIENHAEIILFPKTFAQCEQWLDNHHVFVVKGGVDITSPNKLKIKANQCIPIELVLQEWFSIGHVIFHIPNNFGENLILKFKDSLMPGKIPASCKFQENGKELRLAMKQKIALDNQLVQTIEKLGIKIKIAL